MTPRSTGGWRVRRSGGIPLVERGLAARANDDGWNDGLLYYDPNYAENGNQQIYTTKRFYALGNFSRYVRPGAIRHEVTGLPRALRVLAFEDGPSQTASDAANQVPVQLPVGASRTCTVVVINNASSESAPTELRLQLPLAGARRLVAETAVETSAERDLEDVELPAVSNAGRLSASVPAQSITTYVMRAEA